MSAGGGDGHWLDRLAVAHTRRHAFKTTLAATALTLPLLRARPAAAAVDTSLCSRGCIYTAHRTTNADLSGCADYYGTFGFNGVAEFLMFGAYVGAAKGVASASLNSSCRDRALLQAKYTVELSCDRPNCPGFDPASAYGPCKDCASINGCQCCPDPAAPTGYAYCSSLSNDCCSPNGGCKTCGT